MNKKILLTFLLLIVIFPLNVKALSLDKTNITLAKGTNQNIDLYANVDTEVSDITFTLTYTTYDIPAYLNLEQGLTDNNPNGITHKIIFSNPVSGKIKLGSVGVNVIAYPKVTGGTININAASATTTDGTKINLNAQTLNVTIGEPTEEKPVEKKTNGLSITSMVLGICGHAYQFITIIFMYKNAPADTKNKPIINKKKRLILKIISTVFSLFF